MTLPPYQGYATAKEFDAGYDNSITPELVAHWTEVFEEDSRRALACSPRLQKLRYGPKERNCVDFFPAHGDAGTAPTLLTIHGGLWFLFDRWFMHFLAPAFNAAGCHVACVNYGLAPQHGLAEIVADCREGASFLFRESAALGIDPARISVIGHSAAGQLAALVATKAGGYSGPDGRPHRLKACIGVSGFYDIEPFFQTHFQAFTQFAEADYRAWNPLRHVQDEFPRTLLITGGKESSLLHQMAGHFAGALRGHGVSVENISAADECHFSVLHKIGDPSSALYKAVLGIMFG